MILIEDTIDELISKGIEHRDSFESFKESLSLENWAREFATIEINLPRQTGKTSYIKSRSRKQDLIIVPNLMDKSYKNSTCPVMSGFKDIENFFIRRGGSAEFVFVDEAMLYFRTHNRDEFYRILAPKTQYFVLLGTPCS